MNADSLNKAIIEANIDVQELAARPRLVHEWPDELKNNKELCAAVALISWPLLNEIYNVNSSLFKDNEFIHIAEDKCRKGVDAYRKKVRELEHLRGKYREFKSAVVGLYDELVPRYGFSSECKFVPKNNVNGLDAMLVDEFINEQLKPALASADFANLIEIACNSYAYGGGARFFDNVLARQAFVKIEQMLSSGHACTIGNICELLNNEEEYWRLSEELPELHEGLIARLLDCNPKELIDYVISESDSWEVVLSVLPDDAKDHLSQLIKDNATDEQKEELFNYFD